MRKTIATITLTACALLAHAQPQQLKAEIEALIAHKKAEVGVCVILDSKDTVCVNNAQRYPLMSVMKLHQAMAVAHHLQAQGLPASTPVHISREDLKEDTYSPLRDRYPEGNFRMGTDSLLTYTLQLSDNNACDILFANICSVEETDRYLRSLGLRHFAIAATEADMHADLDACHDNWSTPLEAARLIEMLYTKEDLLEKTWLEFLRHTLNTCQTGKDRLALPLERTGATIGHKTGTGDRNKAGRIIGLNDVGFVSLPDGGHYAIAVLIKESAENMQETAAIIARISGLVYRHMTGEAPHSDSNSHSSAL